MGNMEIIETVLHKGPKVNLDDTFYAEVINNLNKRTLQYSLHVGHIYIFQQNMGVPWTSYAEVRGTVLNEVYKINYHVGMIKRYRELYPVIPIHYILKNELLVVCKGTNLYFQKTELDVPSNPELVEVSEYHLEYQEKIKNDQIYRFEYGLIDGTCLYIEKQGFVDNLCDKNYIKNSECQLDEFKKETILKEMHKYD